MMIIMKFIKCKVIEYDMQPTANRLDVNKTMRHRPINRPNQQIRSNPNYYPQRRAPQVVYNQYLPRQPAVQYNDYYYDSPGYLNVGSIPNIAGLYNQMPRRPETIIVKEVNNDAKVTDYNSDDDDDDDDDDNESIQTKKSNKSTDSKETKISSLKKKLEKGKKLKKKKNNMMYLVIFLLIIIVGLMLYIILNPKAAKKVRF
jgi:ABC-type antimicrobial peptide transport system permease subunit